MDEELDPNIEIATRYIRENYTLFGEDPEHISSADIVRELAEMAEVPIAGITRLMHTAGYKTKFIDSRPYWEVYRKYNEKGSLVGLPFSLYFGEIVLDG